MQKKIIIGLLSVIFGLLFVVPVFSQGNEWLESIYEESQDYGYASDADADDLFETKLSVGPGAGNDGGWLGLRGSVIARTIEFMVRVAVIVAIPMIIFLGVKIITSMGDAEKMKKAIKEVGIVALGLFLALMSVVIVYLIISITRSNIDAI